MQKRLQPEFVFKQCVNLNVKLAKPYTKVARLFVITVVVTMGWLHEN